MWFPPGSAHLVAIVALSARLAYVRSARTDRYKLQGWSWRLHLVQALSTAACLLIALFLLNGRLATSSASLIPSRRSRGVAPYEWVGACPVPLLPVGAPPLCWRGLRGA